MPEALNLTKAFGKTMLANNSSGNEGMLANNLEGRPILPVVDTASGHWWHYDLDTAERFQGPRRTLGYSHPWIEVEPHRYEPVILEGQALKGHVTGEIYATLPLIVGGYGWRGRQMPDTRLNNAQPYYWLSYDYGNKRVDLARCDLSNGTVLVRSPDTWIGQGVTSPDGHIHVAHGIGPYVGIHPGEWSKFGNRQHKYLAAPDGAAGVLVVNHNTELLRESVGASTVNHEGRVKVRFFDFLKETGMSDHATGLPFLGASTGREDIVSERDRPINHIHMLDAYGEVPAGYIVCSTDKVIDGIKYSRESQVYSPTNQLLFEEDANSYVGPPGAPYVFQSLSRPGISWARSSDGKHNVLWVCWHSNRERVDANNLSDIDVYVAEVIRFPVADPQPNDEIARLDRRIDELEGRLDELGNAHQALLSSYENHVHRAGKPIFD